MKTILNAIAWAVIGMFAAFTGFCIVESIVCVFGGVDSNGLRFNIFAMTGGCLAFWAAAAIKYLASQGRNEADARCKMHDARFEEIKK